MKKIFTAMSIALVACTAVFATVFDDASFAFQFKVNFTLATDAQTYIRFRSSQVGVAAQYDFGQNSATDLAVEAELFWTKGLSDDSCTTFEAGVSGKSASLSYEAGIFVDTPFDGLDIVAPTIGIKGAGQYIVSPSRFGANAEFAFSFADQDAGSGFTLGASYRNRILAASGTTTMRIVEGSFKLDDTVVSAQYTYGPQPDMAQSLKFIQGLEFRYAYDNPVEENGIYLSTAVDFMPADNVYIDAALCGSFRFADDARTMLRFNHGAVSIAKIGEGGENIEFSLDYTDMVFFGKVAMSLPVEGSVYAVGSETSFKVIIEETDVQYLGAMHLEAFFSNTDGPYITVPGGMASADIYFINTLNDDCWGFSSSTVVAKPLEK